MFMALQSSRPFACSTLYLNDGTEVNTSEFDSAPLDNCSLNVEVVRRCD